MSEVSDAFRRAKNHATRLGAHLRDAHDAVLAGDLDGAQKFMRSAERSHDYLQDAHAALAEALGAQASDGQTPRASTEAVVNRLLASFRRGAREQRR